MSKEVTIGPWMKNGMAFTARSFLLRLAVASGIILCGALLSRAGGPKCVAGSSYFDATTVGQALVWPQGLITYYTDQGDLSPVLPNASANALVSDAFSQWTSVPTAALAGANGGQLADKAVGRRPGLRVLYMTGYTRNAIIHQGRLDRGTNLISKPFSFEELAAKVRQVLDAAG